MIRRNKLMDLMICKHFKFFGPYVNSVACRCLSLVLIVFLLRVVCVPSFPKFGEFQSQSLNSVFNSPSLSNLDNGVRKDRFLEVPQIVWGLNNQKIAFARACLTARMLNRTLLMPKLSASLFYKEVDRLQPVSFDKVFHFEKFNSLCNGFVRLGRFSDLSNRTEPYELQKGSGRKWSLERDLAQLRQFREYPEDEVELIRIVGKNPFLWHDHWPVKNYAKVFECLVLVDEIAEEVERVVAKIREVASNINAKRDKFEMSTNSDIPPTPYLAVHMRVEIDWMIHCKKLEQRSNINQICSSKEEILERVSHIDNIAKPSVVYLAVADSLLEDPKILQGWKEGLIPYEKKRLGVWDTYSKYPYLIQSAIDYEVCLRADVFVGNSFSTFSSLIVLERTQRLIATGLTRSCERHTRWDSYAYNILGVGGGPQKWTTDMSASSLQVISYGTNNISC
ncbi:hypothetical protein Sjap_003775 [Stephania japonica]|uniref:O-fucosyltransferase family protein n=1 Tax=Stephania japonica TaxID=461633 RepID=A0AAP0PVC7_9MAGN